MFELGVELFLNEKIIKLLFNNLFFFKKKHVTNLYRKKNLKKL
jgi:TfoX/Sxy family transcriptional regulator of competence genes